MACATPHPPPLPVAAAATGDGSHAGYSDPFVILEILPRHLFPDCPQQRTRVQKKTLFPLFDESFEFSVAQERCRQAVALLSFTVMDHDMMTRNDFEGEAFFALAAVPGVEESPPVAPAQPVDLPLVQPREKRSFQGMVASDEHVARDQKTVSVAVRAVSVAIVRRLGVQRGWIHFPETPSERFDAERGFRLLGRIPGVIGCVDGTMISIVGPSKNDPTVTKAAYWCRKYFYALNVMVVCDADCRVMCIDPRYPGSVHDSFVWQFSWLRNRLEQGQLPRDGRFLLGDSGYPLEPWLITPVPGNHATSTPSGRFNKAHSSEPAADVPVRSATRKESAATTVVPTTRDTVGKPLSALARVVPSMDAAGDGEPLATTTEVLTTKDPVGILALSEALPVEAVKCTVRFLLHSHGRP
ncbi:hypothetical protein HPB47_015583 [Ixodes persulcatus]|uniref:Uncharacterized protein n=1 Tax=Ixodes persulcatus TaxID=34615 RepID=A0AC60QWQ0_IXOPE|nr:hypothetical protein HPB47_015583 [Ixodes persulcatus]